MRTALFGGSFDPPHLGHIAIAEAARVRLALDRILFAPVARQPLKPGGASASFTDRCRMTELAIADHAGFALSLIDAPRNNQPNYTIDTLAALHAAHPDDELFLLIGADSLRTLAHWHQAEKIPFAATILAATRPHEPLDDLANCLPAGLALSQFAPSGDGILTATVTSGSQTAPLHLITGLDYDISATSIRAAIHSGNDAALAQLIPANVAAYIRTHPLYHTDSPQNGLE